MAPDIRTERWDSARGRALRDQLFALLKVNSIRGLARVTGISPSHLASIFAGQRAPTPSLLERLGSAAGAKPDELLRSAETAAKARVQGEAADARLLGAAVAYAGAELSKRPEMFDLFRGNFGAFLIASGRADLALASSLYSSLTSPSSLSSRLAGASPETVRAMLHALAYTLFPLEYAASGNIGVRELSLDRLPADLARALRNFASAHSPGEGGEGGAPRG